MLMRQRGEPPCEHLEWDSRHFGLRIARVRPAMPAAHDPSAIADWRREEAIDCLYYLVPLAQSDAVRLAEDLGFRLVDVRITLERAADEALEAGSLLTRPYRAEDLPRLVHLARTLHEDSRFFVDTFFPQSGSRALFEAWMRRACSEPSYQVLVADAEGGPAAYVVCQRQGDGIGQIQLIGVDQRARRNGLGRALVDEAVAYFARHGLDRVRVVTQGRNLAALRLYESSGFLTVAQEVWYHWWAGTPAPADGTPSR
jgi:ribosomal protein S18 acetylase RimI-like enzyme